jgi:NADH dehydrogenase
LRLAFFILHLKVLIMESVVKNIVVVGGGFAGMNFAKTLANNRSYQVTLVDIDNYHSFSPLLYQVAMAFIEPSNISYPFRRLFQNKPNLRFHLGGLKSVDIDANTISTSTGVIHYDYLVLALGTESNYFGMENVKKHALPLKTISDATNLRNHLLLNMERAVRTTNPQERANLLNIVIAGAGPTGVEVAGMLAEMSKKIGPKEYPEISGLKTSIYLVEAASAVLGPMSKRSQDEAFHVLKNLGVKILLNTAVKDYADGKVILGSGDAIPTEALIWTSGVVGREVPGLPASSIGRGRRIMVDEFSKVKVTSYVFAIGDIAIQTSDARHPNGHPQLAQVAIQQGTTLAENFRKYADGRKLKPFDYKNKGTMAIISKYKAVADLPTSFLKGLVAWIVWLFIHLIPIAGFRNKVKLAFSWMWSFITDDPTLRLIIRPKDDV